MNNPVQNSRKFHGDQDWLYDQVKDNFVFWPDEWLQSYKWEMRNKPAMTRIDGVRNFSSGNRNCSRSRSSILGTQS